MAYVKVWFAKRGNSERTAGLVLQANKVRGQRIDEISRYFPMWEAGKMERFYISPEYDCWEEAFHHSQDNWCRTNYGP